MNFFVYQLTIMQNDIEVIVAEVAAEGALIDLVVTSNERIGKNFIFACAA